MGFLLPIFGRKIWEKWIISPEESLLLHAGDTAVPKQLIVRSPDANNTTITFPHNTSLFQLRADLPPQEAIAQKEGIRLFTLPAPLVFASPSTYAQNKIDARTALSLMQDASEILSLLLTGGHSVIAGRLAGAFRNNNQVRIAEEILRTMKKAGYDLRESDPFKDELLISLAGHIHSPYGARIRLMWQAMREKVLSGFPVAPGLPDDKKIYLKRMEDIYVTDAYHSLSIEKYMVTPRLIERVRSGVWNPVTSDEDGSNVMQWLLKVIGMRSRRSNGASVKSWMARIQVG